MRQVYRQPSGDSKYRAKMYKKGRSWVVSGITTTALAAMAFGAFTTANDVHAESSNNTQVKRVVTGDAEINSPISRAMKNASVQRVGSTNPAHVVSPTVKRLAQPSPAGVSTYDVLMNKADTAEQTVNVKQTPGIEQTQTLSIRGSFKAGDKIRFVLPGNQGIGSIQYDTALTGITAKLEKKNGSTEVVFTVDEAADASMSVYFDFTDKEHAKWADGQTITDVKVPVIVNDSPATEVTYHMDKTPDSSTVGFVPAYIVAGTFKDNKVLSSAVGYRQLGKLYAKDYDIYTKDTTVTMVADAENLTLTKRPELNEAGASFLINGASPDSFNYGTDIVKSITVTHKAGNKVDQDTFKDLSFNLMGSQLSQKVGVTTRFNMQGNPTTEINGVAMNLQNTTANVYFNYPKLQLTTNGGGSEKFTAEQTRVPKNGIQLADNWIYGPTAEDPAVGVADYVTTVTSENSIFDFKGVRVDVQQGGANPPVVTLAYADGTTRDIAPVKVGGNSFFYEYGEAVDLSKTKMTIKGVVAGDTRFIFYGQATEEVAAQTNKEWLETVSVHTVATGLDGTALLNKVDKRSAKISNGKTLDTLSQRLEDGFTIKLNSDGGVKGYALIGQKFTEGNINFNDGPVEYSHIQGLQDKLSSYIDQHAYTVYLAATDNLVVDLDQIAKSYGVSVDDVTAHKIDGNTVFQVRNVRKLRGATRIAEIDPVMQTLTVKDVPFESGILYSVSNSAVPESEAAYYGAEFVTTNDKSKTLSGADLDAYLKDTVLATLKKNRKVAKEISAPIVFRQGSTIKGSGDVSETMKGYIDGGKAPTAQVTTTFYNGAPYQVKTTQTKLDLGATNGAIAFDGTITVTDPKTGAAVPFDVVYKDASGAETTFDKAAVAEITIGEGATAQNVSPALKNGEARQVKYGIISTDKVEEGKVYDLKTTSKYIEPNGSHPLSENLTVQVSQPASATIHVKNYSAADNERTKALTQVLHGKIGEKTKLTYDDLVDTLKAYGTYKIVRLTDSTGKEYKNGDEITFTKSGNDTNMDYFLEVTPEITKLQTITGKGVIGTDLPQAAADKLVADKIATFAKDKKSVSAVNTVTYRTTFAADGSEQTSQNIDKPLPNFKDIDSYRSTTKLPDLSKLTKDSGDQTYTISYDQLAKVTVDVYDAESKKQLGTSKVVEGVVGQKVDYDVTDQFDADKYVVTSAKKAKDSYTLSDGENQKVTVEVKHAHEVKEVQSKATVEYKGLPAGTLENNVQDLTWKSDFDKADNKTTFTLLTEVKEVKTPEVKGYEADKKSVSADELTPTDGQDKTVTVTYKATSQNAVLEVVDDDDNQKVVGSKTLEGTFGQASNYDASDVIPAGYVISDGSSKTGSYTFTAEPNQKVVVHVKHELKNSKETTKATVHYVGMPAGSATDVEQDIEWNVVTDAVTGDKTYTLNKAPQNDVTSPKVTGYEADKDVVHAADLLPAVAGQDKTVTVTYKATDQSARVQVVDDDENKTLGSKPLDGVFGQTVNYDVTDLIPENYELVTGNSATGSHELTADANQVVTVHVKHVHEKTEVKSTSTVKFVGLPAEFTQENKQELTWEADKDLVKGETVYTLKQGPKDVEVKNVKDAANGVTYEPETHKVTADKLTPNAFKDIEVPVTYHAMADNGPSVKTASATVKVIDKDNNNALVGTAETISGEVGQSVNYDVTDQFDGNKYEVVGSVKAKDSYTITDGDKQEIVVEVAHKHKATTENSTATVKFLGLPDGMPQQNQQTLVWDVDEDLVTTKKLYTLKEAPKDVEIKTLKDAASKTTFEPEVNLVKASDLTPSDKTNAEKMTNTEVEVVYHALSDGGVSENQSAVKVVFVDDDANGAIVGDSETVNGQVGETVNYDVSSKMPENFVLAQGQSAAGSYELKASEGQTIKIHLNHKHAQSEETSKSTVHFVGLPAGKLQDNVQTITWSVDTDLITGDKTYTNPQGAADVTVENIVDAANKATYEPDTHLVSADKLTPKTFGDLSVTVTYHTMSNNGTSVQKAAAKVQFVDDDANGAPVGNTGMLEGEVGQTLSYDVSGKLPENFVLAQGQSATGSYTITDQAGQVITIHLAHEHKTTTETSKATVHYIGLPEGMLEDTEQTVTWSVDNDLVNGDKVYTLVQGPTDVTVENLKDTANKTTYEPDKHLVSAQELTAESFEDVSVTVTYHAISDEGTSTQHVEKHETPVDPKDHGNLPKTGTNDQSNDKQKTLPQTGEDSSLASAATASGLMLFMSLVFGMTAAKRRKEDK